MPALNAAGGKLIRLWEISARARPLGSSAPMKTAPIQNRNLVVPPYDYEIDIRHQCRCGLTIFELIKLGNANFIHWTLLERPAIQSRSTS